MDCANECSEARQTPIGSSVNVWIDDHGREHFDLSIEAFPENASFGVTVALEESAQTQGSAVSSEHSCHTWVDHHTWNLEGGGSVSVSIYFDGEEGIGRVQWKHRDCSPGERTVELGEMYALQLFSSCESVFKPRGQVFAFRTKNRTPGPGLRFSAP